MTCLTLFITQAFIAHTTKTNAELLAYHEERYPLLKSIAARSSDASAEADESLAMAGSLNANTDALSYETNVLDVPTLWHMARGPRMRVFAIRDRAFGVKRKDRLMTSLSSSRIGLPVGSGADGHGRFNRSQKTLDGQTRFVDFLGRTESDVEEEEELPEDLHFEQHQRESGAGDDTDEEYEHEGHSEESQAKEASAGAGEPSFADWALSMFSKWGTVLGVRGSQAETIPTSDSVKPSTPEATPSVLSDEKFDGLPGTLDDSASVPRTERQQRPAAANGHFHRLSTVGEEEEPASAPTTPMPESVSMPTLIE